MKKLAAVSSLVLFLAACGVNDDTTPANNTPPTVTLATSPNGAAPLTVTLNATASDPDGDALSYAWSLPGLPDAATVQTTFAAPGEYPVSVTVSDGEDSASASVTISVTGSEGAEPVTPDEPENPVSPPTDPGDNPAPPTQPTIKLTASPSGPAPYAVRYDISATGYPQGSTFSPDCLNESGRGYAEPVDDDTFVCFHTATNERVEVSVYAPGNVTAPDDTKIFPARVEPPADIPFEGTWRYTNTASGETGTFTITQGTRSGDAGATGTDATGVYSISYSDQDLDTDIVFNWPTGNGGTEIRPLPLPDGTQRYEYVDFTGPDNEVPIVLEQID